VTGVSFTHAFRTAANRAVNPATDDVGTLSGGCCSLATGINTSGQVVGSGSVGVSGDVHAFRTAPNHAINGFTDDLGTLGGTFSTAQGINSSGQVVGWSDLASPFEPPHAFLYSGGVLYDLNNLVPLNSGLILTAAYGINDLGQIVGEAILSGSSGSHVFRLDPPPASVVSFLLDKIGSFDLSRRISNALTSPLHVCLNAMQRGDIAAARNQLGAFQITVNALRGKKLTDTQANTMVGFAATAIHMIS
jgi:probable HAF family extracellular repeat protein